MNTSKLLPALICIASASLAHAATINFGSVVPSSGTYSNSAPWPTDGSFQIEVGVFNTGFTPSAANVDSWLSNWNLASSGASGVTEWVDDGGDTSFAGEGGYTTNGGPWAIGSQVYFWGFDSRSVGSNQWILLANPTTWVAVDHTTIVPQVFLTSQAGTSAILGSVSGGGSVFQSAAVTVIPEPTTWALVALGATSVLVLRRRRSV